MKFWEELRNLLKAANLPAVPSDQRAEEWGKVVQGLHDAALAKAGRERRKAAVAEGAQAIYDAYPKKVGVEDALKSITAALKKHPAAYLLDKTQQFAAAVKSWPSSYRYKIDGRDTCPHPATWFNQGRYADDPSEWRRAGARSGPDRPAAVTHAATAEQEADADEGRRRLAEGPEPEKGTLAHACWLEARTNALVRDVTKAATAPIHQLEDDQNRRRA